MARACASAAAISARPTPAPAPGRQRGEPGQIKRIVFHRAEDTADKLIARLRDQNGARLKPLLDIGNRFRQHAGGRLKAAEGVVHQRQHLAEPRGIAKARRA